MTGDSTVKAVAKRITLDRDTVKDAEVRYIRGLFAQAEPGTLLRAAARPRLGEKAAPATVNRELAALRAGYRLGLDNDMIVAMPRIKLLPENNARQGFADSKQVESICRHLSPDLADAVRFMFYTGGGAAPRCSR